MPGRLRAIAVLAAACLLAGCSSGPVSEATTVTPSAGPSAAASAGTEPSTPPAATDAPVESQAPPAAMPTEVPPKPGNPTFTLVERTPNADGTTTESYEITWTSPEAAAEKFLVYGVTDCLRYAKKYDGKPCVVRGMRIPRDKLVQIGEAPGDARKVTVSWEVGEIDIPPYYAILIRATNAIGDSIFTIVHSENVCFGCVY